MGITKGDGSGQAGNQMGNQAAQSEKIQSKQQERAS